MSPEDHAAVAARRARLAESTDAALNAAIDAIERGEDPAAAAQAATRAILPADEFRAHHPDAPRSLAEATDDQPRLSAPGWDPAAQRGFLVRLAETGCVSLACAAVGLSRQSAYALRRRHPHSVFAIGWDTAIQMARQALLDEATERALAGREVPVWYHGEQVGTRIEHNDRLLMFLLAHTPDPAHPVLAPRELMQLWPAMLDAVDRVLPPPLSPARLAELDPGDAGDA